MRLDNNMAYKQASYSILTKDCSIGEVGCALLTSNDSIFTGLSINCGCGIGFCAEHSAIAQMLSQGQSKIYMIVSVGEDRSILPPCGRCRELIFQINYSNLKTKVILAKTEIITLDKLIPKRWQEIWDN